MTDYWAERESAVLLLRMLDHARYPLDLRAISRMRVSPDAGRVSM